MNSMWRVILVIVVISLAFGAMSATVAVLTGADFMRVVVELEDLIAKKYNVDAAAFFREWIPQAFAAIRSGLLGG